MWSNQSLLYTRICLSVLSSLLWPSNSTNWNVYHFEDPGHRSHRENTRLSLTVFPVWIFNSDTGAKNWSWHLFIYQCVHPANIRAVCEPSHSWNLPPALCGVIMGDRFTPTSSHLCSIHQDERKDSLPLLSLQRLWLQCEEGKKAVL